MVRIPDANEPNRTADGVVEGANGQLFFFWLGDEAPEDDEDVDGDDVDADEEGA